MKYLVLGLVIGLVACSQQGAYTSLKNVECQQNGGTATRCAKSYSGDYQTMRNEQMREAQ